MDQLLVLLQLTVVEKRLPTEVAHEWLLCTMNQHVGLQSPGPCEPLSTFITPEKVKFREFSPCLCLVINGLAPPYFSEN